MEAAAALPISFSNSTYYNTTSTPVAANSTTTWATAFWPFWIYISIYLILSLTALVLFTISLLKYCALLFSGGMVDLNLIRS